MKFASVWESVGLNLLSLCDIAKDNTREAMNVAKESQSIEFELERFTRDCHVTRQSLGIVHPSYRAM